MLMATALAQAAIFVLSDSVALLADLIHNVGDALTAVPLGIAFFLRSFRGEKIAGLVVVAVIFLSAMVALYEAVDRFIHPKELTHLWALAGAGAIGFLGNEIAAQIRLRSAADSQALHSSLTASMPAWTASCPSEVIASAALVAFGLERADPCRRDPDNGRHPQNHVDAWRTIRATEPGEAIDGH